MWNFLEDVSLFNRPTGADNEYDAHVHLAQMVSLLGDPPEELIKRERIYREHQLKTLVTNPRGEECKTMNEFWGGPFFDDGSKFSLGFQTARIMEELTCCATSDKILREDLLNGGTRLADTVTELAGVEKDVFLDFASGMLQWLPEKRKTAKELLQHPFFDSFYEDRKRDI